MELYVNATGLMWERAVELGALLVWAEHRCACRYVGTDHRMLYLSKRSSGTLCMGNLCMCLTTLASCGRGLRSLWRSMSGRSTGTSKCTFSLLGVVGILVL